MSNSVSFFGAREGSNILWELDDPAVTADDTSTTITARFRTVAMDAAGAAFGRMRRFVQWVSLGATATVTITPLADGVPLTMQANTRNLALTDGEAQRLEIPVAAMGGRFQMDFVVNVASGRFQVGEGEWLVVPRKTSSGGFR